MTRYKIITNTRTEQYKIPLTAGQVVEGKPLGIGKLSVRVKGKIDIIAKRTAILIAEKQSRFVIEGEKESIPAKKMAAVPEISDRQKKINNLTYTISGIGAVTGLILAYRGKKKFWGYVGHFLLFSIGGAIAGNVAGRVFIKKEETIAPVKKETPKKMENVL